MELGTVARAFQLAPACRSIGEIRAKLKKEGYASVDEHLTGGAIQASLRKLLEK